MNRQCLSNQTEKASCVQTINTQGRQTYTSSCVLNKPELKNKHDQKLNTQERIEFKRTLGLDLIYAIAIK